MAFICLEADQTYINWLFFQRVTIRHFILTNVSTCWALHLLVPVLKSLGFSVMFKHVYASVFDSKVLVMLSVKKATG